MNQFALILLLFSVTTACNLNTKKEHLLQETPVVNVPFVKNIYPETNNIPENILKFYIQFSEPMREGYFLKHIRLLDSKGNNLKGIFFDNQYELWTTDHKQITLLVDPGRVKTGLKEHLKRGRAFEVGERYQLIIDTTWKSINGGFLKEPFIKEFITVAEDVIAPNIETIKVSEIIPSTKEPLIVMFGEEMDVLQLKEYVHIISNNSIINGRVKIKNKGKQIQFIPKDEWKDINYKLRIDVRLEDIVANSYVGKFDLPSTESKKYLQQQFIYKTIQIK